MSCCCTRFATMQEEVIILIAEDDEGHASLIIRNLRRVGINNKAIHFKDGQQVLDFLFGEKNGEGIQQGDSYLLLLDIHMPKVDGIEVLRRIKEDKCTRRIPVTIISTTDGPLEVEKCHDMGCSNYIKKSVDYDEFIETIYHLGLFLTAIEIPPIEKESDYEAF